jgi:hypothetical protein
MAYKVFQNGFPLNASELNNYLMNQSVMVFASATARDTDLTAPLEGMIVWLQDSNKFVYYTGSAWSDVIPTSATSGNAIINGAFDIWQRGTSFSLSNGNVAYTADRFLAYSNGGSSTYSRQAFTPGTAPVAGYEGAYFLREVAGAGAYIYLEHKVEDVRTYAGQTVTLSFWAKAGAAFTLNSEIASNFGSGGSTGATIGSANHSLTTSWARYTYTVAMPSLTGKTIGTGSSINIVFTGATTAQTLDIWGVQFEAGSNATAFNRNADNIQAELAACQRYYAKSYDQGTSPGSAVAAGAYTLTVGNNTTGYLMQSVRFPVKMRTAPTITSYDYAGVSGKVYKGGNNKAAYVTAIGDAGSQHGTGDATSANELSFHYVAEAEL